MPFKSNKQRGFLEERFKEQGGGMPHSPSISKGPGMPIPKSSNVNPSKPVPLPNPNAAFAKDIKMPSMNAPNKFGRLKSIMKKSGY